MYIGMYVDVPGFLRGLFGELRYVYQHHLATCKSLYEKHYQYISCNKFFFGGGGIKWKNGTSTFVSEYYETHKRITVRERRKISTKETKWLKIYI